MLSFLAVLAVLIALFLLVCIGVQLVCIADAGRRLAEFCERNEQRRTGR